MFQPISQPAARVTEKLAPRKERDVQRANRIGEAVKRDGGNAMDVALAQVAAVGLSNPSCLINNLKMRVEHVVGVLARDPNSYALQARYGARVRKFHGLSINEAIWTVEFKLKQEQQKFENASRLGAASRLPIMVLTELRLILRLARFKGWDFKFWVDALVDGHSDEELRLRTVCVMDGLPRRPRVEAAE